MCIKTLNDLLNPKMSSHINNRMVIEKWRVWTSIQTPRVEILFLEPTSPGQCSLFLAQNPYTQEIMTPTNKNPSHNLQSDPWPSDHKSGTDWPTRRHQVIQADRKLRHPTSPVTPTPRFNSQLGALAPTAISIIKHNVLIRYYCISSLIVTGWGISS